ncbi:MAG: hypothetical protein DWQ08_05980 [Proteobacteria bacterium]|nr:MAG: hypothetical protein DWQ08_05980 [Pseudomonadota bacterium]
MTQFIPRPGLAIAYASLAVSYLLLVEALQYRYPVFYVSLITENYWGENGTFFAYIAAAILLVGVACRKRTRPHGSILAAIAIGCFVVALEEISWGMWLHKLQPPSWLLERNTQNEFNVHNLRGIAEHKSRLRTTAGVLLIAWVAVSATFIAVRDRVDLTRWLNYIPILPVRLAPFALIVAWLMTSDAFVKSEEIAELALGLLMLLWSADLASTAADRSGSGRVAPIALVAGPLIVVAAVTAGFSIAAKTFFPDAVSGRLTRTAARDFPDRDMFDQSKAVFDHLFRNPQYFSSGTLDAYDNLFVAGAAITVSGPPAGHAPDSDHPFKRLESSLNQAFGIADTTVSVDGPVEEDRQ